MTGRDAPPPVRETARRAAAAGRIVRGGPGPRMFVAHPTATDSGARYVLVDAMGPRGRLSDNPLALVPRVLAVLLTAGALCYLLARYIVAPAVKLWAVTRQVSGGDLSARVGPLLGSRRDELAELGRDFDRMAAQIEALLGAQQRLLRDTRTSRARRSRASSSPPTCCASAPARSRPRTSRASSARSGASTS